MSECVTIFIDGKPVQCATGELRLPSNDVPVIERTLGGDRVIECIGLMENVGPTAADVLRAAIEQIHDANGYPIDVMMHPLTALQYGLVKRLPRKYKKRLKKAYGN